MRKIGANEREIILSHIRVNPTNLRKGFKDAADQIGCSANYVCNLWYSDLRKSKGIFGLKGRKDNVKNTYLTVEEQIMRTEKKLELRAGQRNTLKKKADIAYLKASLRSLRKKI